MTGLYGIIASVHEGWILKNQDVFEEEAEENLSVETEDEIRAGPVDFMSRWLGRRCSLEQSQKLNTDTIFYHSIVVWRDSVIARCLPRKFNINKLDAAVYYERQPKSDVFLQEIHDRADLYKACSLITDPPRTTSVKVQFVRARGAGRFVQ